MQPQPRMISAPRPTCTRTKEQLVEALRRSEARSIMLAAENDRLRHALEIEKANNQFQVPRMRLSPQGA